MDDRTSSELHAANGALGCQHVVDLVGGNSADQTGSTLDAVAFVFASGGGRRQDAARWVVQYVVVEWHEQTYGAINAALRQVASARFKRDCNYLLRTSLAGRVRIGRNTQTRGWFHCIRDNAWLMTK